MKKAKSFKLKPMVAGVLITGCIVVGSMSYTGMAHATMPTYDPGNHVTAIWNNMKRMMEAAKEQQFLQGQIQAIGEAASNTIDSFNNGVANIVTRAGLGEQTRQNIEQVQRAMPAKDVCSTVRVSKGLGEAACETLDQIAAVFDADRPRKNMATGKGTFECVNYKCSYVDRPPTAQEVSNKNTVDAMEVADKCSNLLDAKGNSLCGEANLIVAPPGGELTKEEYEAMMLQLDIAANIETPKPFADSSLPKDSPQFARAQAQDMRRENMRSSAKVGQHMVATKLRGTNMGERVKGDVQLLEEYLNDRLGSENWMCEVTNTCDGERKIKMPDGTERETAYVTPEELEKRKIQMDAVLLHIQLEQYKSMLRTEKYLSDLIFMEIDPVRIKTE